MTYFWVHQLKNDETSIRLLELFHNHLITMKNSVFRTYLLNCGHADQLSMFNRISHAHQIPFYVFEMDTTTIKSCEVFESIMYKVFYMCLNQTMSSKTCSLMLEKYQPPNALNMNETFTFLKQIFTLHTNQRDVLTYFSADTYQNLQNSFNDPNLMLDNFKSLIVDSDQFRIYRIQPLESNENKNVIALYNLHKKYFMLSRNENETEPAYQDHEKNFENMNKDVYYELENIPDYNLTKRLQDNIEVKFMQSESDQFININMYFDLQNIDPVILKNVLFSCLKRNIYRDSFSIQRFEKFRIIDLVFDSVELKHVMWGVNSENSPSYGLVILASLKSQNLQHLKEGLQALFSDPLDDLINSKKAEFLKYIESKVEKLAPNFIDGWISYCAGKTNIYDYIHDIIAGRRQYDYLQQLLTLPTPELRHTKKNEFYINDIFNENIKMNKLIIAASTKYFGVVDDVIQSMAVNGLTEPTSSLQIENMSLELPNNDFGFQKHPDLETFNNGDQLMLLQSYSACRQDQPDRLMFELVVFLINMYFHRIAKNRAAFALLTHKSMCILSKSETQKLSELQDLMDSGLHFVTQNLFTKSQFEEAKLNISQKLILRKNPSKMCNQALFDDSAIENYQKDIRIIRESSPQTLTGLFQKSETKNPDGSVIIHPKT